MTFHLRYRPGTTLAARFSANLTTAGYPTREQAENVRAMCPNADSLEVVEAANRAQNKGSRRDNEGTARENGGSSKRVPGRVFGDPQPRTLDQQHSWMRGSASRG